MLSIVFERCKRVLANHKFVCGVFIDKFRKKEVALGHVGKVGAAGRSAVAADGEAFSASKCACAGWLLEKIERKHTAANGFFLLTFVVYIFSGGRLYNR
jgi:hypothetical protein